MASLAAQKPLQEILDMPEGTKPEIKAKAEALIDNGYVMTDADGDAAFDKMSEEEFNDLGWDGIMGTFTRLTKAKMKFVLEKLIEEANEGQVAQQQQGRLNRESLILIHQHRHRV